MTEIHNAARLRVFIETWSHYMALLESDIPEPEVLEFVMDVEYQLRQLFPGNSQFAKVHAQLLADPEAKHLAATRAALGASFLRAELWPIKNYFSNGK